MPKKAVHISDFTGGINSDSDPRVIEENQAVELHNLLVRNAGRLQSDYSKALDHTLETGYTIASGAETYLFRADYDELGNKVDTTFLVTTVNNGINNFLRFYKKVGSVYTKLATAPFTDINVGASVLSMIYDNGVLTISDPSSSLELIHIYHVTTKRFGSVYQAWVKETSHTPSGFILQDQLQADSGAVSSNELLLGLVPGDFYVEVTVFINGSYVEREEVGGKITLKAQVDDTVDIGGTNIQTFEGANIYLDYSTNGYTLLIKCSQATYNTKTIQWLHDAIIARYGGGGGSTRSVVKFLEETELYGEQTLADYKATTLASDGSAEAQFYNINYVGAYFKTDVLQDVGANKSNLLITDKSSTVAYTDNTVQEHVSFDAFADNYVYPAETGQDLVLIIESYYDEEALSSFDDSYYEFALSTEYNSGKIGVPVNAVHQLKIEGDSLLNLTVRMSKSIAAYPGEVKSYNLYCRKAGEEDWLYLANIDLNEGLSPHDETKTTSFIDETIPDVAGTGTNTYATAQSEGITLPFSNFHDYHIISKGSIEVKKFKRAVASGQRLFAIAPDGYEDRVVISEVNKPSALYSNNYLDIVKQDGDSFVCGESFGDKVYLFKENTLYVLNVGSYEPSTFFIEHESPLMGVLTPNAVCKTMYGLFFANQYGIFYSDGGRPKNIATNKIEGEWQEAVTDPVLIYNQFAKLLYCMTSSDSPVVYIFDVIQNAWTKSDVFSSLTNIGPVQNGDNVSLLVHDNAISRISETRRTCVSTVKTRDWTMGGASIRKKLKHLYVTTKGLTAIETNVDYLLDGGSVSATLGFESEDKGEMIDYKVSINFYSILFDLTVNMTPTDEVKDFGIIYRQKLPK